MNSAVWNWHENISIVNFAESKLGNLALWLTATLMLHWLDVTELAPIAIGLTIIFPSRRRTILSAAALGMIVIHALDISKLPLANIENGTIERWLALLGAIGAMTGGLWCAIFVARNFRRLPAWIQSMPVLVLHGGLWVCLILMNLIPQLATLLQLLPWLIWRLSFLARYAKIFDSDDTRTADHLFYLWPMVGESGIPVGKGLDYFGNHEARDPEGLARSQLAGMKLLLLACCWTVLLDAMNVYVYGDASTLMNLQVPSANLPRLGEVISVNHENGALLGWAIAVLELIHSVLKIAIFGHTLVGILRLTGFNIFRNTYRPLLAESLIDFWNRYYHYFKELLVIFFFYPTFTACRRFKTQLRLFIAVFAAAFFGNTYYHLLSMPTLLVPWSPAAIWNQWGARLVYCFLLAVGVWVSMIRQQAGRRQRANARIGTRIRRIAGVWVFYSVIRIWNIRDPELTMERRFEFFLSLLPF